MLENFRVNVLEDGAYFVSAHTSAHHASHGLSAGVGIDTINYITKYTTKIKAKFFYGDQINFNEPVFKPGRPE